MDKARASHPPESMRDSSLHGLGGEFSLASWFRGNAGLGGRLIRVDESISSGGNLEVHRTSVILGVLPDVPDTVKTRCGNL